MHILVGRVFLFMGLGVLALIAVGLLLLVPASALLMLAGFLP